MTSRGHTQAFDWGNGNAWEQDFRDVSLSGDDRNWADNVDFVHFSAHGGTNSSNVFQGYFGTQIGACTWRSDQARFGDNWNLEYLCIDACNSLELSRNVIATWQNTFQGLHQIFAFTDVVSDASWTPGAATGRAPGRQQRDAVRTPGWTSATRSGATTTRRDGRRADAGRRLEPARTTSASSRGSATSRTTRSRGSAGNGGAEPAPRPTDR